MSISRDLELQILDANKHSVLEGQTDAHNIADEEASGLNSSCVCQ